MRNTTRISQLAGLRFSGLSLLLIVLLVAGSILRVQADILVTEFDSPIDNTSEKHAASVESSSPTRPTIYTYFERIGASKRTTGMTDEQDSDLLLLWKEQWEKAGYEAIILTEQTLKSPNFETLGVTNEKRYELIRSKLEALPVDDFGKVLFRRWLAMAAIGGGWFSDYDSFPLWNLGHEQTFGHAEVVSGEKSSINEKMVVYDIMSPTLAFGSGIEWLNKLEALIEETIKNCPLKNEGYECFYTDSLAIHSIRADGDDKLAPGKENKLATPFDRNDPVSFDDPELCAARGFRKKIAVHFSPQALQRARNVPPKERHPRYRSKLAREWLNRWQELCHDSSKNNQASVK